MDITIYGWSTSAWLDRLSVHSSEVAAVPTGDVAAFLESLPEGPMCSATDRALATGVAELSRPGATRHDAARDVVMRLLRLGERGHPGANDALQILRSEFVNAVGSDTGRASEAEFARMVVDQRGRSRAVSLILAEPTPADAKGCRCGSGDAEVWARLGVDVNVLAVATAEYPATASTTELNAWVDTFTAGHHPERLDQRLRWILADPVGRLEHHVVHLVAESIAGDYAAEDAVTALGAAYLHHGGGDLGEPGRLLSVALGAILSAVVGAA